MIRFVFAMLAALLFAVPAEAAPISNGAAFSGVRLAPETRKDVYIFLGDAQFHSYCDRWEGKEAECRAANEARLLEAIENGIALASEGPLAVISLGDQTNNGWGVADPVNQRSAWRTVLEAQEDWFLSSFKDLIGNHDTDSLCNALRASLDDPYEFDATDGKRPSSLMWTVKGYHSRVVGLPVMISPLLATCIDSIASFCWGGSTAITSPCTTDADCTGSQQCYNPATVLDEIYAEYQLQLDKRAASPNEIFGITATHMPLCSSGLCNQTSISQYIQNHQQCTAPDAGAPCGINVSCPTTGLCTDDRTNYETRDLMKSWLTNRPGLEIVASGHVGSAPTTWPPAIMVDLLGTTDYWALESAGPIQATSDVATVGGRRDAGFVLELSGDGTYEAKQITTVNSAPRITTLQNWNVPENDPTEFELTATDPDYSTLWWTISPSNACISKAASDNCCSGAGFTNCCADSENARSMFPTVEVDCPEGSYTIDVTLKDGLAANTQTQQINVNVFNTGGDSTAPTPDPATWSSLQVDSENQVTLTASEGSDSTTPIYYNFDCIEDTGGCTDSGWQTSRVHVDDGLTEGTTYNYTVQMKDSASPENVGGLSFQFPLTTTNDTTPPTPPTQTFAQNPTATSSSSITMTATTALDTASPPVEYNFDCIEDADGCTDSGWQASATHVDSGLTASTTYNYTVQARDSASPANSNTVSAQVSETTLAAGAEVDLEDLIVPQSRIPDWPNLPGGIGVEGGMPDTSGWTICDTVPAGSSRATLQSALDDCNTSGGGVVVLAAGTTDIGDSVTSKIFIPSNVVLRGEVDGSGNLLSTLTGEEGGCGDSNRSLICFIGFPSDPESLIDSTLDKGDTTLTVADASAFSVGEWIIVEPTCDSCWAGGSNDLNYPLNSSDPPDQIVFYHIAKVSSITGTGPYTITMDRGLYMDFNLALPSNMRIRNFNPVNNAGIENLIVLTDQPMKFVKNAAIVDMRYTANIWLNGNDFSGAVRQNVRTHKSVHVTIANNRLATPLWNICDQDDDLGGPLDIFKTGNGWPDPDCIGEQYYSAYTIQLGPGSQQQLITNNITDGVYIYVRPSHGAHWNVYSHNFITRSIDEYDTHGLFLHGGWPTEQLFEANDSDSSIDIGDEYWGKQGPDNVFYRNRMRDDDSQRIVGIFSENDSAGTKISHYRATLIGNTSFAFFNNIACQYSIPGNVCKGADVDSREAWFERNIARDTRTSPTNAEWGFLVEPHSTTDCGDGLGSASCPGNNVEALVAPGGWSTLNTPDSLYFASEEDWETHVGAVWCQEACDWESETGIGAFGDDFTGGTGSLCKLPAEIRDLGTTCTGVIGVDP